MKKILLLTLFFRFVFGSELDELIKKCENGEAKSCHNAGLTYLKNKNYTDGEKYLKIGCENLEYWPSCNQMGLIYEISKNIPKDLKKAKYYYKKACKFGSKLDCNYAKEL